MKCLSLRSVPVLDPGAKPLEPFGERLECSEGGSTGRRTNKALPASQPAVRSTPNQDRRSARFIGGFREKARQNKVAAVTQRGRQAARGPKSVPCRRSASCSARSAPSR